MYGVLASCRTAAIHVWCVCWWWIIKVVIPGAFPFPKEDMENKEAIERAKSIAAKLESKNQGILLASFDTSLQDNFLYCTTQSINQSINHFFVSAGAAVSSPKSSKRSREDGSSGSGTGTGSGSGRGSSGKTVTKKMYVPVKQYPHANFVGYITLLLPP